jgi:hypothetical protein
MIVLCKSCRIFHNESNKFSLHFSNLSSIFYVFSKFQQKPLYYWRLGFTGSPLELSKLHNQTLTSHQTPWIERKGRNWVPRPWRRRLRPKLGCSGGGFGQGKGGGRLGVHRGSICAHGRGREALGSGLRRHHAAVAVGASLRQRGRYRQCHMRHREVVGGPCGAVRRLFGGGKVGRQELAVGRRWRTVSSGLRVVPRAAFIAGRLPVFATKGCARHNSSVR